MDDRNTPSSQEQLDRMVSGKELAKMLGVHPSTVTTWADKKIIKRYRMGMRTFYDPDEVLAALKSFDEPAMGSGPAVRATT